MKKFGAVILLFFVVFLNSCNNKTNFKIHGTINGGEGNTLYLVQASNGAQVVIDSSFIDGTGKFKLSGYTEHPDFYYLRKLSNKNDLIQLIIAPDEDVEVKTSSKYFSSAYTVKGSKDSELILNMTNKIRNETKRLIQIRNKLVKNSNTQAYDSLKAIYDSEYVRTIASNKTYVMNFIREHLNSLASMVALSMQIDARTQIIDPYIDFEYYNMVDSALQIQYSNVKEVQNMKKWVDQKRAQIQSMKQAAKITAIGSAAPDIEMQTLENKTIKLSSLRGRYVLIQFWAGWSKASRMENEYLKKAYQKYHKKGFEIFQVSLDKEMDDWSMAIKEDNIADWIHVSDLKQFQNTAAQLYNVKSVPSNFLIDREGNIIAKNLREDALEIKLAQYLF